MQDTTRTGGPLVSRLAEDAPHATEPGCGVEGCTDCEQVPATPTRPGGVLVMSDTFPGSWGWGSTEPEAVEQWRRNGGRGASLRLVIDPFWSGAWVDVMGTVQATVTDPASAEIPRRERPPVIERAERVSTNGRRSTLDLDA